MIEKKIIDVRNCKSYANYGNEQCRTPFIVMVYIDGIPAYDLEETNRRYTASFATYQEAEKYAAAYDATITDDTVFLVLKNADFTEGRGPMLADKIFKKFTSAYEYVMNAGGIYGSKQGSSIRYGCNVNGGAYVTIQYNGYDIQMQKVLD